MKAITSKTQNKQRGVAAIEFALIFVILFAVFYALVSYTFPLLIVQTFNHAASEGARAALRIDPYQDDQASYQAAARDAAINTVNTQLAWMPAIIRNNTNPTDVSFPGGNQIQVRISYPYANAPVVAPLTLPGIGQVPRVPDELSATATLTP